ncbi:MAG: 50S ribosomal protein L21 [Zetaproteobacteria bacterium]|nr:50S ribosomal protein L21 [Zetaproteobacteria bacterium]
MQAVVQCGGHQYRVKEGDVIKVDRIEGEVGSNISTDKVLMVSGAGELKVGAPFVADASVELEIKEQKRDPKVVVFKFKRRKNYKRTRGHKQHVTVVQVKKIQG